MKQINLERLKFPRPKIGKLNFSKLRQALKNIKNESSYYAGGTLFIDFDDMPCVGLNLSGRGFTYHPDASHNVRSNILLTKEMTEIVRAIYLEHKGRTEYYEQTVKDRV